MSAKTIGNREPFNSSEKFLFSSHNLVDWFEHMWPTHYLFDAAVEETNRFAAKRVEKNKPNVRNSSRFKQWKPVTLPEMKRFFAIHILTGLVKKQRLEEYWSTAPEIDTPFVRTVMSRNRFQEILSNIHFADNSSPENDKNSPLFDKLHRVRPIIKCLNLRFRTTYKPERELSIDEGGCPWKGRGGSRVYMKGKPHKYNMKLYELCESTTGFCLSFEVYAGKERGLVREEDCDPDENETTKLVMRLLALANCLNSGHYLYIDNYYSSPALCEQLKAKSTYVCGTVRTNRKDLPDMMKEYNKRDKKNKLKDFQSFFRTKELKMALSFRDKVAKSNVNTRVNLLSTIHDATEQQALFRIRHTNEREPQWRYKPSCIVDYNKYMGGVDLNGQMLASYYVPRRGIKWWRKLAFHLFDMAVLNAYMAYQKFTKREKGNPVNHSKFRRQIALHLIGERHGEVDTDTQNLQRLKGRNHFPEHLEFEKEFQPDDRQNRKVPAQLCFVCKEASKASGNPKDKSSSCLGCKTCKKVLCVAGKKANCFKIYHTAIDYVAVRLGRKDISMDDTLASENESSESENETQILQNGDTDSDSDD